jgi:hypothetical protein
MVYLYTIINNKKSDIHYFVFWQRKAQKLSYNQFYHKSDRINKINTN